MTEAARFHEASPTLLLETGDLTVAKDEIEHWFYPEEDEVQGVGSASKQVSPGVLVLAWTSLAPWFEGPMAIAICHARGERWAPVAVGMTKYSDAGMAFDMFDPLNGRVVIDGRVGDPVLRCRFDLRGLEFPLGPEATASGEFEHRGEGELPNWVGLYVRD